MNSNVKNHRVIKVKFLGPTNTLGDRIQLTEARFRKTERKTISYSYSQNCSTVKQAINYLDSIGINCVGHGEDDKQFYIFSDSWSDENGFIELSGKLSK